MSEPTVPSPIHLSLIEAARRRPDRHLVPPERVRGRARRLLGEKLLGLGLAERIALQDGGGPIVWWIEADRGAIGLRLASERRDGHSDAAEAPQPSQPAEPRAWTKIARVLALLRRPQGADLRAIVKATGWLPHTARAALTGLRRKGHAIEARKEDDSGGGTVYRIAPVPGSDGAGGR